MEVTINRFQYQQTIAIDKQKLDALNIALLKICRETGEDENEEIIFLKSECETEIIKISYNFPNSNYITVWVQEPFSKDLLPQIKSNITRILIDYKKYIKIISPNGMKYIEYPLSIRIIEVDEDIFDVLRNEHNISSSYFKCYEWDKIQNSDLWIKAQIQVAKEIIAQNIYDDMFKIKNKL